MPGKTVPLSVRMAPDDMTALSELDVSDAITPSDKIRTLVRQAHRRQKGQTDYAEALAIAEEQLMPTLRRIRGKEARDHIHSDLVVHFLNWLPDVLALVTTTLPNAGDDDHHQAIQLFERDIADRIAALLLSTLKMALTPATSCYSAKALDEKLPEVLELARLVASARNTKEGVGS
ncbi:MAG: hypothetical protein ACR2RE_12845 [Geminicoccaceae bacterium]